VTIVTCPTSGPRGSVTTVTWGVWVGTRCVTGRPGATPTPHAPHWSRPGPALPPYTYICALAEIELSTELCLLSPLVPWYLFGGRPPDAGGASVLPERRSRVIHRVASALPVRTLGTITGRRAGHTGRPATNAHPEDAQSVQGGGGRWHRVSEQTRLRTAQTCRGYSPIIRRDARSGDHLTTSHAAVARQDRASTRPSCSTAIQRYRLNADGLPDRGEQVAGREIPEAGVPADGERDSPASRRERQAV